MKTGLTQPQRKARTRRTLVETARRVFLERGFHGASLDDIADPAGYSKGAVYSNFASKADLFLAVLDAHFEERARAYADVALDGGSLEDSYRAVARFRFAAEEREPEWEPLPLEFWTYAARREDLRTAVTDRRERFLDVIAGLIEELASRHGVAYAIPTREVARGSAALLRGMAIERMLDPSAASLEELELEQLPTLPKATFMREFDRIVTDPQLRLADLEAHLAGPDAATPFRGRYRAFASSGSSGLRGVFVYSEEEFATWVAAHLPVFGRIGVGPSTRLAPIGAPSPIHLSKQLFAAFGRGRNAPPRLSVLTPLREICDALESFRPDAVIGYASVIAALAQEQLDGRVRIAPRIVATGAELLTAEMEQRVVDAWGVRPVQIYATTEAPIVAASAPGQRELRVLADLVWIEVVDEHNRPVPAGTAGHKVLLTNLVNRVQPLIRYELTDSVTLAAPDVIASIDGRSDDILVLPGTHGGQVAVHPVRLRAPFARLPEVALYQLVASSEKRGFR